MKNNLIVSKFGGTSVATAAQLRKVQGIIHSDPRRRVIVVSAPGKAHRGDTKITDLLLKCHALARGGHSIETQWKQVTDRFQEISNDLNLEIDLKEILDEARHQIEQIAASGGSSDFAASRGEAIHGRIVAEMLGAIYVDAAAVIHFDQHGQVAPESYHLIAQQCVGNGLFVIPGFYGIGFDGNIKTFSRGGSDITGAIVANAVGASVYENWTDVPGVLMTDPRIVAGARSIREITYRELRELAYAGAGVLHADAVYPAQIRGIPINIRNTDDPNDPGTMIVAERTSNYSIIGIAGAKDFTSYDINIPSMLTEVGVARRAFQFFEDVRKPVDHFPSGIDNFSVVVSDRRLGDELTTAPMNDLRDQLAETLNCGDISTRRLALIVLVGDGAMCNPQTHSRLFAALHHATVGIEMVTQSTAMSIVLGVSREQYEVAVRALYDEFAKETDA